MAEWEHKERDRQEKWQQVERRNGRRKGPRGLAIGATVQVETTGAGREEDQRWETRTVLGHTYTPEGFKHHLLEAGRGTKETHLRKTRWRTGEGGELGSSARQMGWGGQPRGAGESRTGVAPMRLRQLWTGEREEGRTDATLRRAKEGMVAGLAALQRAAGRAQGGGVAALQARLATALLKTPAPGRLSDRHWRALSTVVAGAIVRVGGDESRNARGWETGGALEVAVRAVQEAAADALMRWQRMSKTPRKWARTREGWRERMRVIVFAWAEWVRRNKGQVGRGWAIEQGGGCAPAAWLPGEAAVEWSWRPGVTAMGVAGKWLSWKVLSEAWERAAGREQWAAWRARRRVAKGEARDLGEAYSKEVRGGKKQVRPAAQQAWEARCAQARSPREETRGASAALWMREKRGVVEVWAGEQEARWQRRVVQALRKEGQEVEARRWAKEERV